MLTGKLLQESFYKPLRRLGVPRALCIICCFVGSSALHALPQFLSTRDLSDLAMMGSFFVIHGFIVLLEQTMLLTMGPKMLLADNMNGGNKEIPIVIVGTKMDIYVEDCLKENIADMEDHDFWN